MKGLALERVSGADYAKYVRAPDGRLISITTSEGTFNYFFDGSANVVGIIKSNGTADYYGYMPFGEDLGAQGTRYNPFRFAGAYQETVNGKTLYHMGARWYSREHGRFTQADPISVVRSYEYGWNNPVNVYDPSGEFGIAIAIGGVVLVGVTLPISAPVLVGAVGLVGAAALGAGLGTLYAKNKKAADKNSKKIKDIDRNPGNWVKDGEKREPSKTYKGGTSVREILKNKQTGETIERHTIYGPKGKVVHGPHYGGD